MNFKSKLLTFKLISRNYYVAFMLFLTLGSSLLKFQFINSKSIYGVNLQINNSTTLALILKLNCYSFIIFLMQIYSKMILFANIVLKSTLKCLKKHQAFKGIFIDCLVATSRR